MLGGCSGDARRTVLPCQSLKVEYRDDIVGATFGFGKSPFAQKGAVGADSRNGFVARIFQKYAEGATLMKSMTSRGGVIPQ